MRPTEEALALMAKIQQSFQGLEDIARFYEQLRKQRMGRLSISVIPAIGHSIMPDAIRHLRAKFEHVLVSLHIASSMEVAMRIRDRQTDIGIAAQGYALGEIEAIADFAGDCMCIAPKGALPSSERHVSLQQLTGRPYVTLTSGTLQNRLEDMMRASGLELEVMAEASQSLSASELVLQGLGISVVDPFTGAMHRLRGGAALPLHPGLPYKVQMLAMSDARLSEPARELLHYLKAAYGNH